MTDDPSTDDAPTDDPSADDGSTGDNGLPEEFSMKVTEEYANPVADVFTDLARESGVSKPDAILVAQKLSRRFGGLTAVDVEHLEIQRGGITALIGPNGAGKTTFFNLLTGFDTPNTGHVELNGQSIDGVASHKLAARGMVRTFQLTKALSKLTVLENMMLGAKGQSGENLFRALISPLWRRQEQEIEEQARKLLERFKLTHMTDEYAGTLSGGQRKLVEMARALMTDPELVMLDEPMAGVNPALTQSLLGHVKQLRAEGRTVVFVEHDMDVVQDISDWVVVMAEGRIIAEGPPASIAENQAVVDAYLGSHHDSELQFDDVPAADSTDDTTDDSDAGEGSTDDGDAGEGSEDDDE